MTHNKALEILNLNFAHDENQLTIAYKNRIREFSNNTSIPKEIYEAYLFLKEELKKSSKSPKYSDILKTKKETILNRIENDTSTFGSDYFVLFPKTIEYTQTTFLELNQKYTQLIQNSQIINEIDSIFSKYNNDLICTNKNFVKIALNEWCLSSQIPKEKIETEIYDHFNKLYSKPFFEIGMELTNFLNELKNRINNENKPNNNNEILKNLANMYSLQYKEAVKNNNEIEKCNALFQRLINLIKNLTLQKNIDTKITSLLSSINLSDLNTTEKIVNALEKVILPGQQETSNKII